MPLLQKLKHNDLIKDRTIVSDLPRRTDAFLSSSLHHYIHHHYYEILHNILRRRHRHQQV